MILATNPSFLLPELPDLADPALAAALQSALDQKTKPVGSLGRLESLALQLGLITGRLQPELRAPQLVVFAGDHGLAARGVSAYPSDVTWQMVENFLAGGAAVSVLARQHGLALQVVDCGVRHDFAPRPGLVSAKVAPGTADASRQPAMSAALLGRTTGAKCKQLYERAGAGLGADLVQELFALRGRPQAEALRAVHDKLHALSKLEYADSATGGFAAAIVNVLELGVANLPKHEGARQ